MKKLILLLLFAAKASLLCAQVFFTEDFSSGIPAGWTNVDNSGNNIIWRTTTTGASNGSVTVDTVLNSVNTSAANGYLIIDSDSAGQSVIEDAVLTSSAINCSGHGSVHLTFNEYFAQYLASTGTVSVSNDNVNWTVVHLAHNGLLLNQGTPNANAVDVDITGVAGGQAAVYIRFYYHGEWDYWWFVDDVRLVEPPAIDLSVNSIEKLNSEYTLIPFPQATALTLSAEVKNNGATATSGGSALFEIVNVGTAQTVFSETINLPPISAGAFQTIIPASQFIPTGAGNYKSKLTLNVPGDLNAANDIAESDPISLSDSVYARDDDNFAGTQGIGVGPGEDAVTGQNFFVNNTDLLTSVTFFMDDNFGAATNGTPVFLTVHPQLNNNTGPDGSTVLAVTDTILFLPGMIPSGGAYYTVPIQGGAVQLSPGLYYIGIHETDSILTIGYTNAIYTPGAVWVHWNSIPSPPAVNGWAKAEDFTLQIAYMIRANFGNGTNSINETEQDVSLSLYPNPCSGAFELTGLKEIQHAVSIKIFNQSGKQVYAREWKSGNSVRIDPGNIEGGVYLVQAISGDSVFTKKLIIIE